MGLTPAPVVVLKFGGTSVSSRERWQTIADIEILALLAAEKLGF